MATNLMSGGQLVVAALRAHRVDMAFSVAGESYLEVLDALVDAPDIRLVTCRQEGGAAFMAEAYGKLTGKPGLLLVTRGPGACNASIGIHTAFQDSTPMVVWSARSRDTRSTARLSKRSISAGCLPRSPSWWHRSTWPSGFPS